VERPSLDILGGQERGDKSCLLPHVEGEEFSGDGQSGCSAQPCAPHEVRRGIRAARGQAEGRSARGPRGMIIEVERRGS
jgi:hypothetical protein